MVSVADATVDRWDDLRVIFGDRGDPAHCWCQWFRLARPEYAASSRSGRCAALQEQFATAPPPGVIGYDEAGEPVAWCAIAPRCDYPRLARWRTASVTSDEDGLWAVTCFVVKPGRRRRGMATVVLDGAIDMARRHGARIVEAYPLDTSVRAASAAELFHGPLSVFLAAGFTEVGGRRSPARPVVRLPLS